MATNICSCAVMGHYVPEPCEHDIWPIKLKMALWITWDTGN